MKNYSKETHCPLGLERLIRNQRDLCSMYINDMDKESQFMAKYYSDRADEYEAELKLRLEEEALLMAI